MDFTEKHFIYNDINSLQYDLRILHLDTTPIQTIFNSPENTKIFNKKEIKDYVIGSKWEEKNVEFDIEFVSDSPLSYTDQRKIKKWLFGDNKYHKLYIVKSEDEFIERINGQILQNYIECVFTSPEIIEYGDVYGYKAKAELSAPFSFQDTVEYKYVKSDEDTDNADNNIEIIIDNDIQEFVYPQIIIEREDNNNKNLFITSNVGNSKQYIWDNNILKETDIPNKITLNSADITSNQFQVDCANEIAFYIDGDNKHYIFSKIQNQQYLKLVNGNNILTFSDNIKNATISFNQVRFLR